MRDNKINDQDLSNVSGAGGFMGRKAKVYAISGTQFGFYHNDNFNVISKKSPSSYEV